MKNVLIIKQDSTDHIDFQGKYSQDKYFQDIIQHFRTFIIKQAFYQSQLIPGFETSNQIHFFNHNNFTSLSKPKLMQETSKHSPDSGKQPTQDYKVSSKTGANCLASC